MSCYVEKFGERIPVDILEKISNRYHTITKSINKEFWNSDSVTEHSLDVGSYGRGTAIDASDVDMLVCLPSEEFEHFNNLSGNSQSRLLQSVKNAILSTYPNSDIKADGQVVVINFSDGIKFEVLPAFINRVGAYRYPDTNMGGRWKSTNPKDEQEAMKEKNNTELANGLLFDTCKHIRRIHTDYFSSYKLSGIVIDSFVFAAIGNWRWTNSQSGNSSPGEYEKHLLQYFNLHVSRLFGGTQMFLNAPGSQQEVETKDSLVCLEKVLNFMVN